MTLFFGILSIGFYISAASIPENSWSNPAKGTLEPGNDAIDENAEFDAGPVTEEVMDPKIRMNNEAEDYSRDRNWNVNRAVRDVAYFLRAHKFQDFDRRYYTTVDQAARHLYQGFPKPPLRSLHWQVNENCADGFHRCLRYLERIVRMSGGPRREDDAVTVIKEHNWDPANDTPQILAAQKACRSAQRRDNATVAPFQGPIERFRWRTSASYYMCWYTMLEKPELKVFGETCDNRANCLDVYGANNRDPRANDGKPFACALYSFCPDECCPLKHVWYARDCLRSPMNPCYRENKPCEIVKFQKSKETMFPCDIFRELTISSSVIEANRRCRLNREENRDLASLILDRINVTCECHQRGYEWSSRFGLCVDIDECARGMHDCDTAAGQRCINLRGRYECGCNMGFLYNSEKQSCLFAPTFARALRPNLFPSNETSMLIDKSAFSFVPKAPSASSGSSRDRRRFSFALFLPTTFPLFLLLVRVTSKRLYRPEAPELGGARLVE